MGTGVRKTLSPSHLNLIDIITFNEESIPRNPRYEKYVQFIYIKSNSKYMLTKDTKENGQ